MTPAQMIINSLYGLFQKSELATLKLLEIMEKMDVPKHWDVVDLIKQTASLMQSTTHLFLTDDLLFVRKAHAIIEFCVECKNLLRAFKLDVKPTEGEVCGSWLVVVVVMVVLLPWCWCCCCLLTNRV